MESALIVPPKDAFALATAIETLFREPELAGRLGTTARRIASADFSRVRMLDRMEDIFIRATQ